MILFFQVMWGELKNSVLWHLRWYLVVFFALVQVFKWLFENFVCLCLKRKSIETQKQKARNDCLFLAF